MKDKNIDQVTVKSFGDEWARHDQSDITNSELQKVFDQYFSIFNWDDISHSSEGFDMGCGTGRWANFVAPKVKLLNCIDPSDALKISIKNLSHHGNIKYISGSANINGLNEASQDFGYSLGVLHHIPDTQEALNSCSKLLKSGAPFLVYLYYRFDNRGFIYRLIWKGSDILRSLISFLPSVLKNFITDILALLIYFPLAKISKLFEFFKINPRFIPLSFYRNHSFKTMRTDSRDRFGTPLEQRFTKIEIENMMKIAGFEKISFSDKEPYWVALGYKI